MFYKILKQMNCMKFKEHRLFFFLFFLCLFILVSFPFFAVETSPDEPIVTVKSTNEPLKKVLDNISRSTGYKIEVSKDWEDKLITIDIQNMTLDDSIKKILRAFGSPNTAIVEHVNQKKIKIDILGKPDEAFIKKGKYDDAQLQAKQAEAMINLVGKSPIKEQPSSARAVSKIDPMDIEVIPPTKPGEKGITLRELDGTKEYREKINPLDVEVIPPKNPGEKGITIRELKEMRTNKNEINPLDIEVIPPKNPGEKGITVRELQQAQENRKKIDPVVIEMFPPENP